MELKKREEIIKALECHKSGKLVECEQCPLDKAHLFNATCVQTMCENALALIKELTEEIKDLEADYDRVYEQAEADIRGNMADGGASCHWCIAGHKRDTIQKMQTMIKEECLAGGIYPVLVARAIEKVGNKLLEETEND